jgi:hypothetical protein
VPLIAKKTSPFFISLELILTFFKEIFLDIFFSLLSSLSILTFKLFDKVEVKGGNASPLFKFLEEQSGREIQWNFSKFLINKNGEYVKGFGTQKTPEAIEENIKELL